MDDRAEVEETRRFAGRRKVTAHLEGSAKSLQEITAADACGHAGLQLQTKDIHPGTMKWWNMAVSARPHSRCFDALS